MRAWILILLAAAPAAAEGPGVDALLQSGVASYREGKLFDALDAMTEVLEKEPANATAKSYLFTITKKIQEKDADYRYVPAEAAADVARAEAVLQERRQRTLDALAGLERAHRLTGNVRDPSQILAGIEGLERHLGADFAAERVQDQADAALRTILEDLSRAIKKGVFVSEKDHLAAQAHLAYYQGDRKKALRLWEEAVRRAPEDGGVKRNRDALETLLNKEALAGKIREAESQAAALEKTGYFEEAAQAWAEVLRLNPGHPFAVGRLAASRKGAAQLRLEEKLKRLTNDGIGLYKEGKFVEAAQVWLEVLQADPEWRQARVWLAQVGPKLKTASTPSLVERRAPVSSGDSPTPANQEKAFDRYKEGLLYYAEEQPGKAIEKWREALKLDPTLVKARQALDQAQWELGFNNKNER